MPTVATMNEIAPTAISGLATQQIADDLTVLATRMLRPDP